MSTIARFTLKEYERMIGLGVFDWPFNRRIELIRGEIRERSAGKVARFTLEEYERMAKLGVFDPPYHRKIELIHGLLMERDPHTPAHDEFNSRMMEWSFRRLDLARIRIRVKSPIAISEWDSMPEPDLAWLTEQSYFHRYPTNEDVLMVVEVADASLEFDRREKACLYAEGGIPEYWIVNIVDSCIEVYRDPAVETYQSVTRHDVHDTISPLAFPDVSLSVGKLFEA